MAEAPDMATSGTGGGGRPPRLAAALPWALLALGIALLLYARFNGVSKVILPYLQRATAPSLYARDFYVNHSMVPGSSQIFPILAALRLDLTGPAFLIGSYLLVTALAAVPTWRLIGRVFGVDDPLTRAALLFATIFADAKLLSLNKSGWMLEHNFSFTFIAAAARCWFLYFALAGRPVAMCALLVPINFLSFKVGWPLTGFAALILLLRPRGTLPAWLLLAGSLVPPVLAALAARVQLSPAETRAIFDLVNAAHPAEDNPFAGGAAGPPLFVLGSLFLWFQAKRYPEPSRLGLRVITAASFAIFLLGGLYLTFGHRLPPLPVAVLLSPARALESAALLIYLAALVWIVRSAMFDGVEKTVLMLAAITLKIAADPKWVVIPIALATVAIGLRLARRLLAARFDMRVPSLPLPVGVALLAPLLGGFFALNLSGQRTTYRYDPALGFYDAAIPADAVPMLRTVAAQPGDRRLLFVAKAGRRWQAVPWNLNVAKSSIDGDFYYLPRLAEMRAQQRLDAIEDRAAAALTAGAPDPALAGAMRSAQATLVAPASARAALPGWIERARYGDYVELAP